MALENNNAIEQTINLIKMFNDGIKETKIKYADNPKYLQSSIERAQNQIERLTKDLHCLLEIPTKADMEETSSGTIILYGDQGSEAYMTLSFLRNFLKNLRNAFKTFLPENEPMFCIRAASTGSLHLSLEPIGENKQKGVDALREVGKTAERLHNYGLIDREKLTPFEKSVARLLPRKDNGIQRIMFKGTILSPQSISISRGEVKTKKPREAGRKIDDTLIAYGKIIHLDLVKNLARISTKFGNKTFAFKPDQKEKVLNGCMVDFVSVQLKMIKGSKRYNLERLDCKSNSKQELVSDN